MPSLPPSRAAQNCRWHPFPDNTQLEQAALNEILRCAQHAIDARGAFHVVLAGGTTPRRIYEALSQAQTKWSAWHIYFGDERCLPPEHDERNSRMAALAWLDQVNIPRSQIHPIPAEQEINIAAARYAGEINAIEAFDLVLLGLGEDGHTASLFPRHDAGDASDAPATLVVLDAPKPPPQRISLSARRLSAAHRVMFLVTGKSKLQAIRDWRSGALIPAAKITPENGVDIYVASELLD